MAKAVPDAETYWEVWVNRALGRGVGRHQKTGSEAEALAIAETLTGDVEVLKVTTTRKAVKR